MLVAVLIAVVVTLWLSLVISFIAWAKGQYGIVILSGLIATLMICCLPIMGKLMT
jgi:hypothetical protein